MPGPEPVLPQNPGRPTTAEVMGLVKGPTETSL